jgi:hypothetical protein
VIHRAHLGNGSSTGLGVFLALVLTALLALSPQLVAADSTNVTIAKATDASGPQAPGDTYTYTLTTTVGALAVTDLRIQDGSLDFPQISITGATYSVNGATAVDCANAGGQAGPADVDCRVGSAPASASVVVTINVAVASDVQVACDNPTAPGTLDDDIRNRADVTWRDADNPAPAELFAAESNLIVTDLDCTGYEPGTPTVPDTTITSGPAQGSTTTSTSASFEFTGTNSPTAFECKLDGGAFVACTSPQAYSGLAVGSHTFEVRAINAAGTDATPASRTWTVQSGSPSHPFTDVADTNQFVNDIIWLYNEGITRGCNAAGTLFCPTDNVRRDEMATFLDRALGLPTTSSDFFSDDNGNQHEAAINRLAAAGITLGCGGGRYCPAAAVTRAEMATFLVRAYGFASTGTDFFSDDEATGVHEANINALRAAGVTNGCNAAGTLFCPNNPVTREQMAAFIHRAET